MSMSIYHPLVAGARMTDNGYPMRVKPKVKYPHLRRAAREMGYDFSYLWRVLEQKSGYRGRPGLREEYLYTASQIAEEKGQKGGRAAAGEKVKTQKRTPRALSQNGGENGDE